MQLLCQCLIIVVMYVWSNCSLDSSNSQVLHNRLDRILLKADIRTHIHELMQSMKWSKLDKRWENHLLMEVFRAQHLHIFAQKFCLLTVSITKFVLEVKCLKLLLSHIRRCQRNLNR